MNDEFEESESQFQSIFDFKAFLIRALSYWKLYIIFIGIGVFIVYQQNIRKQQSYRLSTQISIEEESNPLFTSTTSLTFNWGGVSGKVQTMMTSLSSRSIHEKVVDNLQFYISYLRQARFRKDDIYKEAPFRLKLIPNTNQVLNSPIKIVFLDNNTFELTFNFQTNIIRVQNFTTKERLNIDLPAQELKMQFTLGEPVILPYFNGTIELAEKRTVNVGDEYFIKFSNFDAIVANYKNRLAINNPKNSAILNLSMVDVNKGKIVDYLNEIVKVLSEDQLNRKNQFVTNTINFIDAQLERVKTQLTLNADSLNNYREQNKIFSLDGEGAIINNTLTNLELKKDEMNRKLAYYASLKTYLETSNSFTDVPAPAIAGIDDGNILGNIGRINQLSVQKSKYESTVRKDALIFNDLNRQIEGLKTVLFENISSVTNRIKLEMQFVNTKIVEAEAEIRRLPKAQQKLLSIRRQYALSEQTYNVFLAKRGEADIIKSASVSDVLIIDTAKDTGAIPIDLKLSSRYIFAIIGGFLLPLALAFLLTFLDHKIHNPKTLENLSKIPLLGVIGKSGIESNLIVHLKPKSVVAESFRGIRSSLQYMYSKRDLNSSKTVMVTSSVSGEGKTFCSINIATVFALSGKKTILVGLDLRKPKIFGDFEVKNNIGAVNYLIGQNSFEEIIQQTNITNLDVITSGPIPPNPSELLIGERTDALLAKLKETYDFIVLDTPPIGLVADAFELLKYSDATVYVVRQDYTEKNMLNLINDKYRKGEVKNLSFLYNFYNQKGKYGYSYGYGYGYGNYANGYHDEVKSKKGLFSKFKKIFKLS